MQVHEKLGSIEILLEVLERCVAFGIFRVDCVARESYYVKIDFISCY